MINVVENLPAISYERRNTTRSSASQPKRREARANRTERPFSTDVEKSALVYFERCRILDLGARRLTSAASQKEIPNDG